MGKKWKGSRAWLLHLYKKQNGNCYYCGRTATVNGRKDGRQSEDTATIEHLYDKQDIRRYTRRGSRTVKMCCQKCNTMADKENHKRRLYFFQHVLKPPIKEVDIRDFLKQQNSHDTNQDALPLGL